MKNVLTYLLCLSLVFLPACNLLTPEQKEAARESIQFEHEQGRITLAQRDAALEALDAQPESVDWATLLTAGGSVVASVILGVPIAVGRVNKVRGPITKAPA